MIRVEPSRGPRWDRTCYLCEHNAQGENIGGLVFVSPGGHEQILGLCAEHRLELYNVLAQHPRWRGEQ